ncbi:hypothetical protein AVEN_75615-2-1, partial [Araneus ventricosus]
HLSERRANLFNPERSKSRPLPLSQFSAAVFTSLFEENLVPDKCSEPRLGAKSGLYGGGWLQTSHLNSCSYSCVLLAVWVLPYRRMIPTIIMPGRFRRMVSRWPSDYFPLPKLKVHSSSPRFSSNSRDMKTAAENWLNGQGRDFDQAGLNKLVLSSDKCLNIFGDYVEK